MRKQGSAPGSRAFGRVVIYVVLIAFLVISLYPILFSWLAALKTPKELMSTPNPLTFPRTFTIDNFTQAWTQGKMGRYMWNSVMVAIPTVALVLFLASMAGFAFGKLNFPGRDKFFFFFLLGMMIPAQALIISLYYIIVKLGLVNNYLGVILPTL
ncbi:MAG: carbohydrate ABC transporter permease, partial [Clostridia bacterium]